MIIRGTHVVSLLDFATHPSVVQRPDFHKLILPKKGIVYTVRELTVSENGNPCLYLMEIINEPCRGLTGIFNEPMFLRDLFRPLKKLKVEGFVSEGITQKVNEPA